MSRQFIFLLATLAVMLYFFSIALFMLGPLHTAGIGELRGSRLEWCKKLQLRDPPARDAVALVSFPGSGNTWLRYLLQQATGIMTGSIYHDTGLLTHGFPGEGITDGAVLVVKTHKSHPQPTPFKAAVLLIRKPRDAILADYNRVHRGHLGVAPRSAFHITTTPGNKSDWARFVSADRLGWYEELYKSYLQKFSGPVLPVSYEALVCDTERTLRTVLEFLNVTVSQEDMKCVIAFKEGIYRRRKKDKNFDPFTPEMYRELDRVEHRVLSAVTAYGVQHNVIGMGWQLD